MQYIAQKEFPDSYKTSQLLMFRYACNAAHRKKYPNSPLTLSSPMSTGIKKRTSETLLLYRSLTRFTRSGDGGAEQRNK